MTRRERRDFGGASVGTPSMVIIVSMMRTVWLMKLTCSHFNPTSMVALQQLRGNLGVVAHSAAVAGVRKAMNPWRR